MAKVFLNTNILIDLVEKRKPATTDSLDGHDVFISPLSIHIFMYVTKQKVPYKKLSDIISKFQFVTFNQEIVYKSLGDPTSDFEDNVQLHSAAEEDCDIFLTSDSKLLNLKFFGKTQIKDSL